MDQVRKNFWTEFNIHEQNDNAATKGSEDPRAAVKASSKAGTGSVNITVTGSVVSDNPLKLDFIDIVGLDGIEEDMKVVVPGLPDGGALPKWV